MARSARDVVIPDVQTITGALASSVGTWITQRHQNHCDLLEKKIFLREQLYSDFISESTRILVDALEHNLNDADRLIPAYALVSRMRLNSSPAVLASADKVIKNIVGTYAGPNLSPEEIRPRIIEGADPLREFSELCRGNLEAMQRQLR